MTVSPSDLTKWFQSIAAGPQSPCPHGGSNESRTGNEQVSVFFLATDEPGRTVCGSCLGGVDREPRAQLRPLHRRGAVVPVVADSGDGRSRGADLR